jgi:Trypsin
MRGSKLSFLLLVTSALLVFEALPAGSITWGVPDGNLHPNVGAFAIKIQTPEGSGYRQVCTGSLINPRAFLTAGHCQVLSERFFGSTCPRDVKVTFDPAIDDNGDRFIDPDVLLHGVAECRLHPQFKFQTTGSGATDTHDIAVLVLKKDVTGITPLGLPPSGFLDDLYAAGRLVNGNPGTTSFLAVGYGNQQFEPPQHHDRDGLRRMVNMEFQALLEPWLRLSQVHTPGQDDSGGTCGGDSGGPGFWVEVDGTETLVSITSWGDTNCVASDFRYRVDTPGSLSFIHSVIDRLSGAASS